MTRKLPEPFFARSLTPENTISNSHLITMAKKMSFSQTIYIKYHTVKLLITRPYYNGSNSDFTAFWVDWHPQLPDSMMGLYGDVFLTTSGNVRLSNPAVVSNVAVDHAKADLTFVVDVNNLSTAPISGTLTGVV